MATMIMSLLGGLGIFMLGMKYMSEGMQAVAGNSLRRMISLVTDNRLLATATGTAVTMVVQSSSISTVIIVGLVNAGLMQLHQAVGFIMGANIGTTITGWVLVLKVDRYGLPVLGLAALVHLFARRDRVRFIAMAVMGLGMVFFGLELMKQGVAPLRDMEQIKELIYRLNTDSYLGVIKCVTIGCILTCMVQSSSAALAILIAAAVTGLVPFPIAAAVILGENIGTTITVVIATLRANTSARRAAYAHVLFNVFGVCWVVLVFPWFVRAVAWGIEWAEGVDPLTMTFADFADPVRYGVVITAAIAMTHTSFNVTNTLLFLPFVRGYARLLERMVPGPLHKEVAHLKHLDARTVDAPVLGVEQSRGEVVQMGIGCTKMLDWIGQLASHGQANEELIQKTFHREEVLDNIEQEIVAYLTELLDATFPVAVAEEGRQQLRIAHEYESISDAAASILKGFLKLRKHQIDLAPQQLDNLKALHEQVTDYVRRITAAYEHRTAISASEAEQGGSAITRRVKDLRDQHLQLMTDSQVNPMLSMTYTTQLTNYRRIRAHAQNIHEAVVGTKSQPRD